MMLKPVDKSAFLACDSRVPSNSGLYWDQCGTERFSLPQSRVALAISWQSSASAVVGIARDRVRRNAMNSPSELPVPQEANRNQKYPRCVTHSARGLRPGTPRIRSNYHGHSSALAQRVKAQGAPSREKWGQGGETECSQGALHRKGTEYARREAFPWLGTEENGFARYHLRQKRVRGLNNHDKISRLALSAPPKPTTP